MAEDIAEVRDPIDVRFTGSLFQEKAGHVSFLVVIAYEIEEALNQFPINTANTV